MTDSLRAHGGLTESSRETMSGKGREGNKERKWKGSRSVEFQFQRLLSQGSATTHRPRQVLPVLGLGASTC